MSDTIEDVIVEVISKKDLKALTTAANLLNGAKDLLMDAEFRFETPSTSPSGYTSYIFENVLTDDQKKMGKNAFFYTPAVAAGVEINDKTEYQPLFRLLLEKMGDADEIEVPKAFKIVAVEDAMYTKDDGTKVKRYPLHMYKEFEQEMKDESLSISGIYGRGDANREFFGKANNWTVTDANAANPDATVKKISIQLI